jgi:N-acetylglucosaminyl-diphospho-decaprenol L-rhamnosyltransferase
MATSVITVTYNSGDVVAGMLQSLPSDVQAIVVDNASSDGGAQIARAARPETVVVELPNNQGFGHGCNVGAGVASGDVLVFLNPDCMVTGDALTVLAAHVAAEPHSIFGPAFVHQDGTLRHDVRRRSQPYHEVVDLLPAYGRWVPQGLRRDLPHDDDRYTSGGEVDYLQGACLAIGRDLFRRLGGFDEDFFLYSEEETLCQAARDAGGHCTYAPDAVIRHVGGTSTGRVNDRAMHHFYRSRAIFYRKRYGFVGGLAAAALISIALITNLLLAPFVKRYGGDNLRVEWHSPALSVLARGITASVRR